MVVVAIVAKSLGGWCITFWFVFE